MRCLALWPITPLSKVMSPTSSTTTTSQGPLKFSSRSPPATRGPSYLHDSAISNDTIGRALSSPLFTQERQEPAGRRQAYHSLEESLLSSQSLSVGHVRTVRPVNELSSLVQAAEEKPSRDLENEQIRILLERQKEQILADCIAEIQKHEFQADYDRRVSRNWMELSSFNEVRLIVLLQETNNFDEINNFFMNNYWNKIEWKNWREFKGPHSMNFREENLIEDRDTILELTAKLQELQNEVNCMNDSRDFKDAESVRSGQSQRCQSTSVFPPFQDPGGMLSRSLGMPSRNDKPPSICDTHGISGNVFANLTACSSAPYPQESNPWVSNVSEHTSPHVMSESQTPNTALDPRCRSGQSARNSFDPGEGRFSKNYGADQQRLQISDPHFDKFPTPATFACWKIRNKTDLCSCPQFPTEAMLWIKVVEMVESVDDLKSSCSMRGIRTPYFEVPDAKIASAQNRIIHNTRFKKKISLEEQKAQKEDRFLRGRQIAYLICDASGSLEPTILSIIMPTYLQLSFEMIIFRNSIRNGTKIYFQWRKSIWSHHERIVQMRIRESEN